MFFTVLSNLSAFSMIIACVIGMARFGGILPAYRPFLFFIWIAVANDLLSYLVINSQNNNVINSNFYVLVEYGLLLMTFYRLNGSKAIKMYSSLFFSGACVWALDNLLLHSLDRINSIFRVTYSVVILLLSIRQLSGLIMSEKRSLARNAVLLMSISFMFYFSFKAFFETFYILQAPFSSSFYFNLFVIFWVINLFTNLTYAITILWIPRKQEFTIP